MKVLVTGCAGFIGSHLCPRLLSEGHEVLGVDSFTDYYPPARKRSNLEPFSKNGKFKLVEADLSSDSWNFDLGAVEAVFHLAGQPGVRASWGQNFELYVSDNILATQRLLERLRDSKKLRKFVFASSSSVYGEPEKEKVGEDHPTRPHSPYGVTKLAAEHLCMLYAANYGMPAVALRFFTVYGPRQRPDMGFSRLIEAALGGGRFEVYGDGSQEREFTYVSDVVEAVIASLKPEASGVFNVGGGSIITLREAIGIVENLAGLKVNLDYQPWKPGDLRRTGADISRARKILGYRPRVGIKDGLKAQIDWVRSGK